ncbi:CHY zinc finger-domain-containing protein [Lipomyces mesembrius]
MTLTQMIDSLDERLEEYLKAEKRETIKLVNVGRGNGNNESSKTSTNVIANLQISDSASATDPVAEVAATYTEPELQAASTRREREIRQLHARLSGTKLFSADEVTGDASFTVPFDPVHRDAVPVSLRNISTVRLIVPKLYSLVPVGIDFSSIDTPEARAVEANFGVHAHHHREFSLFAHMNFLVQNVVVLAAQPPSPPHVNGSVESERVIAGGLESLDENYRKPPEWDMLDDDVYDEESDDDYDDPTWFVSEDEERGPYHGNGHDEGHYSESSDEDSSDMDTEVVYPEDNSARRSHSDYSPPRGTSINFPGLRLNDIGVVECTLLSIVVKCLRCKTEVEIRDIKPGLPSGPKGTICAKCSTELSVASLRTEFMHENAVRLGYIDVIGCTPTDILPSAFMPSCGNCSEPLPGTTGIAGLGIAQTISTNCRSCHTKMSIFIPQVKFSRVSDEQAPVAATVKKRAEVKLGIVAGTSLPLNGTCKHYKRSTRWFRFSCCNRVFPCDKCHNEQSDHADEHASRMICGMCSREQNYQPEVCAYCRHSFFRKNTGFWEGGRGTRDKVKMSRKDPRKYKRRAAQA